MSKSDDEGEREFTDLDAIQGEWIAHDVERKAHDEVEHFRHAHSKDPIDGIMNAIFGTSEECVDPRCRSEQQYAEFKAEEEATGQSESWWDRWFRGSDNGGDGEGGGSD